MDLPSIALNSVAASVTASATASATALIAYVLTPAIFLFVLLGVIIWWRSGMSHVLLTKAWAVFAGQATIRSEKVAGFVSDERDLAHFRFLTRTRVSTLNEAERLIDWTHRYGVSVHLVRSCRHHFDLARPGPKESLYKLRDRHLFLPIAILILLASLIGAASYAIAYDRAVISVNATGNYFTIDEKTARPLFGEESLHWGACEADGASTISAADRAFICATKPDAALARSVNRIVQEQRAMATLVLIELFIMLALAVSSLKVRASALNMKKKLIAQGVHTSTGATLTNA